MLNLLYVVCCSSVFQEAYIARRGECTNLQLEPNGITFKFAVIVSHEPGKSENTATKPLYL